MRLLVAYLAAIALWFAVSGFPGRHSPHAPASAGEADVICDWAERQ